MLLSLSIGGIKMNVVLFYYDGFCEFEVVLCAMQFKTNYISVGLENRVYVSEERQKFLPDKTIDELNPDEVDLFIIPGGEPAYLYDNIKLENFIKELNKRNKVISGICGGTSLMAKYGLLKDKKCTGNSSGLKADDEDISLFNDAIITNEDVVIDGNIITSTGQAFIEFSVELGKIMGNFQTDEDAIMYYKWLKNIK